MKWSLGVPIEGLVDPGLATDLARDGFVRAGKLLTDEEVLAAQAIWAEATSRLGRPLGDAWFPTILLEDDDVRAYITEQLGALIGPKLDQVVSSGAFDVMRLDFSVKPASPMSELGPHQDYALVDEAQAQSLYLWIPLCDTNNINGTLHVVPGSHRFTNRVRSRHVPAVFDEVIDEVHDAAVRLDCRAGELIIMVSGVVHFSPPNRSENLRLAAHCILTPVGVPLVFYYADDATPPDAVECYEVDIDRYVRSIHEGRPGGDVELAGLVPRPEASMTPQRFRVGLEAYSRSLTGDSQG